MHIYKAAADNGEERQVKSACAAVSIAVGSAMRSAGFFITKFYSLCVVLVSFVGIPQPRIEWFKDAVPLSKLANPRYKVTTATGLMVRRVQPGDGGVFQCIARNAAGETQAYTQLLVSSEFF